MLICKNYTLHRDKAGNLIFCYPVLDIAAIKKDRSIDFINGTIDKLSEISSLLTK